MENKTTYKFVALLSGGKDSVFNMMKLIEQGNELVAIGVLYSQKNQELDSYMYQTVGVNSVEYIAKAIGVSYYSKQLQKEIIGKPKNLKLEYTIDEKEQIGDEVEDLFQLLKEIQEKQPEIQGVSSGAIASSYQKIRVENVLQLLIKSRQKCIRCKRLNLISLALLWNRNQKELLKEMIDNNLEAIIIKTSSFGLDPAKHLGKTIKELYPYFLQLYEEHGFNICGEGGEYETLTLDCPIYKKKLQINKFEIIEHSDDPYSKVSYLNIHEIVLVDKISQS